MPAPRSPYGPSGPVAGDRKRTWRPPHCAPALALAALALTISSCGLAIGPAPTAVDVLVTREFGREPVQRTLGLHAREGEIVASLVGSPRVPGQEPSLFVNGELVTTRPAHTPVHPGDHIWSDLHMPASARTPAVVGSFPEPFLNGTTGKRLPVRVECAPGSSSACATVAASLRHYGVPAALAAIGSGAAPETLRVLVGRWPYLGDDPVAQSIAEGPGTSGVYALISRDGSMLTLLARDGRPAKTLGAGAGLIAATQARTEAPVWVVTGTNSAGVELAANSLTPSRLAAHFAVALEAGTVMPLPLRAS